MTDTDTRWPFKDKLYLAILTKRLHTKSGVSTSRLRVVTIIISAPSKNPKMSFFWEKDAFGKNFQILFRKFSWQYRLKLCANFTEIVRRDVGWNGALFRWQKCSQNAFCDTVWRRAQTFAGEPVTWLYVSCRFVSLQSVPTCWSYSRESDFVHTITVYCTCIRLFRHMIMSFIIIV